MTVPPRHPTPHSHQLLRNLFNLGRWSSSGSDRGIAPFLTAQEIQSREWEEKTNKGLGLLKCKKGDSVTLCIPLCICRLTLAWISSKISTKLLGMPTHLDRSSLTAAGLYLMRLVSQMSGVDSQMPLCISRHQLTSLSPFVQLLTCVLFLLPVASRSRVQTFCLVSRQNRQRNRLLGGPLHWGNYSLRNPSIDDNDMNCVLSLPILSTFYDVNDHQTSKCKQLLMSSELSIHIYRPLHSGRIWHKVNFLSGV